MDTRVYQSGQKSSIGRKVAIVGIGCRFPNDINNVQDFWEMLERGLDCTKPHPKERIDSSFIYHNDEGVPIPGKIYCRAAGYLSQSLTGFDRLFFQMSPDEADHMDPQLRLLLEVVWESLEDYGVNVGDLRQSNTGVYVGVMAKEYSNLISVPDLHINKYTASGNNSNMMSNRVSYQFDFQGPSITYDTACSSSMYAIHHACEAIRNGACNLALAGGVNLFLLPSTFVALCQARMLSPDGKCKSFDSSANGYARGEGAGILVLKSLEQAIQHGDRIYAVIDGGALNNDGKTSGITSPSAQSQMMLLKRTYEIVNISPQDVPYVEAHGTGTQAGDKAEATALGRVLGDGRGKKHPPLIIGSVKSNFGHTEGAAGVAGVIKTSLILQNKKIPKILHFQKRNENVDWNRFKITFPTELMDWPEGAKHIAGCSSFGFGGANAHLVLEAAPTVERSCSLNTKYLPALLLISAASKDALNKRASDWLNFLTDSSEENFWNILLTAATRATHHPYRLAICCKTLGHAWRVLADRQNSKANDMIAEGRVQILPHDQNQTLVFVFSGMGTQWWAMGRQLMEISDVFREIITRADKLLKEFGARWSLKTMLTTEENMDKIHDTAIAQPAICALQIALAEVYRQLGILPHAVIGHSVGEVAAACVSGYITFQDAIKLIYIRGKLLKSTAGKGAMAAIFVNAIEVTAKLSEPEFEGRIDIACVNSPTQTVISGNVDAVKTVVDHFKSHGHKCVTLKVQNAFHSFQQEKIKSAFLKLTGGECFHSPIHHGHEKYSPRQVPMISTVNGMFLNSKDLNNNQYWWKNIRQTVQFEKSLLELFEKGYNIFLEIGAHPSLAPAIKDTMAAFSDKFETYFHENYAVLGSLKRPTNLSQPPKEEEDSIFMSIAKLYVQGYPLNLEMLFPDDPFNVVSLPKNPWIRQDCIAVTGSAKSLYITPRALHPLLGESLVLFHDEADGVKRKVWKSNYNLGSLPWLPHHNIENVIILPGAAYIEMMLTVAKSILEEPYAIILENVQFHKFHDSPECIGSLNTIATESSTSNQWQIAVSTFNENNQLWAKNATCSLVMSESTKTALPNRLLFNEDQMRKTWKKITTEQFYEKLAENGVDIGSMFQGVTEAFYNFERQECLVYAALPKCLENELITYVFHPCLLDAVFQSVLGFTFEKVSARIGSNVEVPKSVGTVTVNGSAPSSVVIKGKVGTMDSSKSIHLKIANAEDGKVFAKLENVKFASLGSNMDLDGVQAWEKEWVPVSRSASILHPQITIDSKHEEDYVLISDNCGVTDIFCNSLYKAGISPEAIKVCESSQDTKLQAYCKQGSRAQNVIVLTFMNYANFKSLDDISREQFFRSQINDPMSLMKTVIDLYSKEDTKKLSFWIITKGAVLASKSDGSVNPLMSNFLSNFSLVMNIMNEFPTLTMTNLDLPFEQSIEDSMQWLSAFFLQPERSENYLALRPPDIISKDGSEFELFSMRIKFKPSSDMSFRKDSDNWMIDIGSGIKSVLVKPADSSFESLRYEIDDETCKTSEIIIQVMTFTRQYQKNVSNSTKREVGFLFGGTIQNQKNPNGITKNVLGYKRGDRVTSVVKVSPHEVVPIHPDLVISETLYLVKTYLPLLLALQETFKMPREQVVMFTSDKASFNQYLAFGAQIASAKDNNIEKVIVYVQDSYQLINLCSNYDNVIVTTSETFHTDVSNGSVDTLLIHQDFMVKSTELDTLFSKVRFCGTVATLTDSIFENSLIKARQLGVRVVDLQYIWVFDNTALINQLTDSLLKLLTNNDDLSDRMNQLLNNMKLGEISTVQDQAIDDHEFDCIIWHLKPTLNIRFAYSEAEKLFKVDSTSAFLIVGGTKGIGVEIAHWLINQGAMSVYISGRNEPTEQVLHELNQGREKCRVMFITCDITDEKDTEELLETIKSKGVSPLSIFHCAAMFDNQRLENVSQETWGKVLLPKAYGLLLLHKCTKKLEIPIKDFVAISSIVQYLGNAGQGSYCSANTFLHLLCQTRRLQNLPATVIAPGAIGKVGYAAREGFDKVWENRGIRALDPSEIVRSLSWALGTNTLEFGFSGALLRETFMRGKLELFQNIHQLNRFSMFKSEFPPETFLSVLDRSRNIFASLNASEAIAVIDKFVVNFLRQRLGLSEEVSKDLPLFSFGFDSAMSWELSSLIWSEYNVVLSSVELLNDSVKISNISSIILSRASERNATENVSTNKPVISSKVLWLHEPPESQTYCADLFCFPPTGKGPTLFAEWGEIFMSENIRLVVIQLPGWEGRENEQASHDLSSLIKPVSEAIMSKSLSALVGFFGSGIGSLLAFETARYLQAEHNFTINHIYISGWYPPSTSYINSVKLKHLDKKSPNKDNKDDQKVVFLDNRDIRQTHNPRKTFLNLKASEIICKSYKYVLSKPLQCNMTMFSGVRDTILTQKVLSKWRNEIDPEKEFDNVALPTDHKLLRNKKFNRKIAYHVIRSLLREQSSHSNHSITQL